MIDSEQLKPKTNHDIFYLKIHTRKWTYMQTANIFALDYKCNVFNIFMHNCSWTKFEFNWCYTVLHSYIWINAYTNAEDYDLENKMVKYSSKFDFIFTDDKQFRIKYYQLNNNSYENITREKNHANDISICQRTIRQF